MQQHICLVAGAHRSGTTWIGRALAEADDCAILHEPFNYQFGVDGVPQWYPKADTLEAKTALAKLFEEIVSGRARYRTTRSGDSLPKAIARRITGGPDNWTYRRQMKSGASHLVLKDPFCTRMALWLAETYHVKSVILVRHPGAYLNSLKRMSWTVPEDAFDHLPAKEDATIVSDTGGLVDQARRVGNFWNSLYSDAIAQSKHAPSHIKIMRHEDLCIDPVGEGEALFRHLGIPLNEAARDFFRSSTNGEIVNPDRNVLHSMKRNAKAMIDSWRESLSQEECAAMSDVTGDVVSQLYPNSGF